MFHHIGSSTWSARSRSRLPSQKAHYAKYAYCSFLAAEQTSTAVGIQKTAETPTLTEMNESFDPDHHGGEVMVTEPVGAEEA